MIYDTTITRTEFKYLTEYIPIYYKHLKITKQPIEPLINAIKQILFDSYGKIDIEDCSEFITTVGSVIRDYYAFDEMTKVKMDYYMTELYSYKPINTTEVNEAQINSCYVRFKQQSKYNPVNNTYIVPYPRTIFDILHYNGNVPLTVFKLKYSNYNYSRELYTMQPPKDYSLVIMINIHYILIQSDGLLFPIPNLFSKSGDGFIIKYKLPFQWNRDKQMILDFAETYRTGLQQVKPKDKAGKIEVAYASTINIHDHKNVSINYKSIVDYVDNINHFISESTYNLKSTGQYMIILHEYGKLIEFYLKDQIMHMRPFTHYMVVPFMCESIYEKRPANFKVTMIDNEKNIQHAFRYHFRCVADFMVLCPMNLCTSISQVTDKIISTKDLTDGRIIYFMFFFQPVDDNTYQSNTCFRGIKRAIES